MVSMFNGYLVCLPVGLAHLSNASRRKHGLWNPDNQVPTWPAAAALEAGQTLLLDAAQLPLLTLG